jgi:hypothetical protein
MTGVGYLIMLSGMSIQRLRPTVNHLPPMWIVKIGGAIMPTGMLLANVLPGVFTWLDYSTPAYIQRLLYLALGGLFCHLLFVKALNWLSARKQIDVSNI